MVNSADKQGKEEDAVLTANALKAMAHPIRWRILCALGERELTVREIIEKVGTTQSNVSQHLEILRNKHIINSRKEGNRVFCSVRNQQLQLLIENMRGVLCKTTLDD
ncbi:MAG: winged helix-turn-helix transcriptional regulator [Chromatiales bacterium]|nr:winged helix-turn-helix transcriptional regulator [Chromatiales bacterium]